MKYFNHRVFVTEHHRCRITFRVSGMKECEPRVFGKYTMRINIVCTKIEMGFLTEDSRRWEDYSIRYYNVRNVNRDARLEIPMLLSGPLSLFSINRDTHYIRVGNIRWDVPSKNKKRKR